VRGGGHHFAGYASVDGGVTIDLSRMRGVSVDGRRRVARVEGGALWSDVDRATHPHGLATPGGTASSAFLDQLFDDTIGALVAYAADTTLAAPRVALLPLGGAVARVPGMATAFGGRGTAWLVSASASWADALGEAAARAWIEQLHDAVAGDASGVGYVNMLANDRPAHSVWTRARLRAVEAVWDPENRFRSPLSA
jgi:hypothetical protein